jgi:hypothetical protein
MWNIKQEKRGEKKKKSWLREIDSHGFERCERTSRRKVKLAKKIQWEKK